MLAGTDTNLLSNCEFDDKRDILVAVRGLLIDH